MDSKRQLRTQPAPTATGCSNPAAPGRSASKEAPRLGEILVAQGKITAQQLAIALDRQKTSGRRLGEELIKAGFVQRGVVSRALRMQRRIVFGAFTTLAATSIAPHVDA